MLTFCDVIQSLLQERVITHKIFGKLHFYTIL